MNLPVDIKIILESYIKNGKKYNQRITPAQRKRLKEFFGDYPISQIAWHYEKKDFYMKKIPLCNREGCNNPAKFDGHLRKYQKYCSFDCFVKDTSEKRYDIEKARRKRWENWNDIKKKDMNYFIEKIKKGEKFNKYELYRMARLIKPYMKTSRYKWHYERGDYFMELKPKCKLCNKRNVPWISAKEGYASYCLPCMKDNYICLRCKKNKALSKNVYCEECFVLMKPLIQTRCEFCGKEEFDEEQKKFKKICSKCEERLRKYKKDKEESLSYTYGNLAKYYKNKEKYQKIAEMMGVKNLKKLPMEKMHEFRKKIVEQRVKYDSVQKKVYKKKTRMELKEHQTKKYWIDLILFKGLETDEELSKESGLSIHTVRYYKRKFGINKKYIEELRKNYQEEEDKHFWDKSVIDII